MANPNHYNAHIKIRVDGKEYPTLAGGRFQPHGYSREDVAGWEVHGFKRTAVSAQVSVELPTNFYTDFENIGDHENVTIEVETDTGQIWLMANAWTTNPINIQNGDTTLEYHAKRAERIA